MSSLFLFRVFCGSSTLILGRVISVKESDKRGALNKLT